MQSDQLTNAVLYTSNAPIINVFRSELKRIGIENKHTSVPSTPAECRDALKNSKKPFFLIDWALGMPKLSVILPQIRGEHEADLVPTMLIVQDFDKSVLGAATEFGVSEVITGEISPAQVRESLEKIQNNVRELNAFGETFSQTKSLAKQGKYQEAIDLMIPLYTEDDSNQRLLGEIVECYIAQEKWSEAANLAKQAVDRGWDNPRMIYQYGRCLMHQNDYAGASRILDQARLLNPYNPDRLVDLGDALLHNGDVDTARVRYDEALEMNPTHIPAKKGNCKVKLIKGEIDEAVDVMRQITSDREMASIFNMAAVLSTKMKQIEHGLNLYDSALSAIGNNSELRSRLCFNKGVGLVKAQKLGKAREMFQQAVDLDPKNIKAKHNLDVLSKNSITEADYISNIDHSDDQV